jgi:hypothetical protein
MLQKNKKRRQIKKEEKKINNFRIENENMIYGCVRAVDYEKYLH